MTKNDQDQKPTCILFITLFLMMGNLIDAPVHAAQVLYLSSVVLSP